MTDRLLKLSVLILLLASLTYAAPFRENIGALTAPFTFGGLTFFDFEVVAVSGNPTPWVDLVSVTQTGNAIELFFNPNMTAPPALGPQDLQLSFMISGPLSGIGLSIAPAVPGGPAPVGINATINETIFTVGAGGELTSLSNIVAYSHPPGPTSDSVTFAPANQIFVLKDISVLNNYPNAGGGALSGFSQTFYAAPEPLTWALMGSGLLALGFLRRRRQP